MEGRPESSSLPSWISQTRCYASPDCARNLRHGSRACTPGTGKGLPDWPKTETVCFSDRTLMTYENPWKCSSRPANPSTETRGDGTRTPRWTLREHHGGRHDAHGTRSQTPLGHSKWPAPPPGEPGTWFFEEKNGTRNEVHAGLGVVHSTRV